MVKTSLSVVKTSLSVVSVILWFPGIFCGFCDFKTNWLSGGGGMCRMGVDLTIHDDRLMHGIL